ncbi:MAG: hypothetical protein IT370_24025 [Deltaproteobacteria bacterium]|nr:hypothetical protein [Deltaproteobacteria bacterium]
MGRSTRCLHAALALTGLVTAFVVQPALHLFHHREDHVHIDGQIVYVSGSAPARGVPRALTRHTRPDRPSHRHGSGVGHGHGPGHSHLAARTLRHDHSLDHAGAHDHDHPGAPGRDSLAQHRPHGDGGLVHFVFALHASTPPRLSPPCQPSVDIAVPPEPASAALTSVRRPAQPRGPPQRSC